MADTGWLVADYSAWTNGGTKYANTGYIQAGELSWTYNRGANKFDITTLPAAATVTQVEFKFEVTTSTGMGSFTNIIGGYGGDGYTNNPSTDTGGTFDGNCDVSADYYNIGLTEGQSTGSKTVILGSAALADIEAARDAGTVFSLAYVVDPETTNGTDNYIVVDDHLVSGTEPQIKITYVTTSITSINGGSAVTDGQTSVAVVASGFTAIPTAGVISDVGTGSYVASVSNITGTATNFTCDFPDVAAITSQAGTAGTPFDTASHTHIITFTYSAETANIALVVNPKANWNVREVDTPLTTNGYVGYVANGWPFGAAANTDQYYFYSTETVDTGAADYFNISAAGLITTNLTTGTVPFLWWDATNGLWYYDTIDVGLASGAGGLGFYMLAKQRLKL